MDVELVHFRAAPIQEPVMFMHTKVVMWKTKAASVTDLPGIELKQANQELEKYFKQSITYDQSADKTWWSNLFIGNGDLRSRFQSTWTLTRKLSVCRQLDLSCLQAKAVRWSD